MTHENLDYIERLRTSGYRVTPQRLIVLDAICEIPGHASLSQIIERVAYLDPSIDKSTIYRALDVLCEVGLATETTIEPQGKVYSIAGARHHHLSCRSCGKILTIPDEELGDFQRRMLEKHGFRIQLEHLAFKGLCRQCLRAG
ncbi:MAG: Fur family transcriptional regulator [Chloroflexi bacterium]|nr:Fur family transcriptional regulator [Chloroflexota bacterium]